MAQSASAWWNASWQRRMKLKFDNSFLAAQQDSIPVMVKLTPGRFDYSTCRTAGRDIRFVDADDATQLDYEIEDWNENGESYIWVRVPAIAASATADSIWIYYDNPTATDAQDADAVWNADYVAVWHLNEAANNDADNFRDASGCGNHGQGFNFDGDESEAGMAGRGLHFNGSDEYINCGSDATLDLGPTSDITLMAWVKPDSVHHGKLICKNTDGSDKEYDLKLEETGQFGFEMEDGGNDAHVLTQDSVQADDTWLLAASTFDNSTLEVLLYGDGTELDTVATGFPIDDLPDLTDADVELGRRHYDNFGYLDGILDEVRILKKICSAAWMEAQYKSMSDALINYGSEETNGVSGTWWNDSWTRRRTITIDNGFVSTQQDSFTALVKLWNQRIDYDQTQGAGQDIRFIDADGTSQLNYEIEEWNESGTSYVWVRLDDIKTSATSDSIFMYYGNNTVTDDQDTANTWNGDYQAVWHLGEDAVDEASAAAHLDATGNYPGTQDGNEDTVGILGTAQKFDGTDDYIDLGSDLDIARNIDSITVLAMFKTTSVALAGQRFAGFSINSGVATNYSRVELGMSEDSLSCGGRAPDGDPFNLRSTPGGLSADTWHFVTGMVDYVNDNIRLYIDGSIQTGMHTPNFTNQVTTDSPGSYNALGSEDDGSGNYFSGLIDEIRVLHAMKTDLWVEAQDSSMRDNLFDFGAETVLEEDTTGYGATWWNTAWRRRIKLKFDNSYLGSQQDSIPIMVTLTPDRMDYSKCRTAGRDIRFVDADNSASLSYEIEEWDEGGASYVWVRVPDIKTSGTADSIWMYYDNPTAVDAQADSAVWNSDFAAVWHLNEEGNTGADGFQDATSNRNHGQGFNFDGNEREAGMAGGGLRFNGSDEYINCGSDASLDLGPASDITLMAWVKPDSVHHGKLICKNTDGSDKEYDLKVYSDGRLGFEMEDGGNNGSVGTEDSIVAADAWLLAAATFDNSTMRVRFYPDGTEMDTVISAPIDDLPDLTDADVELGRRHYDNAKYLDGVLDEVRILGTLCSAEWMETQYKSMSNGLIQYGAEQTHGVSETWWHSSWTRRRTLSIDNGFVSTQQDSFTALVKLWNNRIDYDQTQGAGQDLRFIDADLNSQLNYEIEEWNESGTSYVWVRLDDIKATGTTDSIFMYYGNNTVTDDQDTAGTWNGDYVALWHLNESSGNHVDVTGGFTGTRNGNSATAGMSGQGQYFDGNDYINLGDQAGLEFGGATDSVTFTAWVKNETGSESHSILSKYNSSGMREYYFDVTSSHDLRIAMSEDGLAPLREDFTDDTLALDTWFFVAVTLDLTNDAYLLYVDGALWASSDNGESVISTIYAGGSEFHIGAVARSTTLPDNEMIGSIDEVRISRTVRTPLWIEAQDSSVRDHLFDFGPETELEEDTTGYGATWWDTDWRRRVKISIGNSFMSSGVSSFPVMVKLTPDRIDYSKCRTNGRDIRFVDADNGTELDYEMEQWDEGGYSYVWVQVPDIPAAGTADSIWLYYDNPLVEDAQDAAGVWDNGYVGVWHMGDDLSDKTGNGLDAVNYGTEDSLGLAGMASCFNKTASDSDTIVVPYDAAMDNFTDQFTINVMVRMTSNLSGWRCIANRPAGPGTDQIYTLLENKTGDTWHLSCSTATTQNNCDGPVVDYGSWELVTGTYDGSEFKLYIDGDSVDASAGSGNIAASTADFLIGAGFNSGKMDEFIDGIIDEVRLSNVARSTDWIEATDSTMRDNLLRFGSEQTYGVGDIWWHTSWTRRRTLSIDNGFVDSRQDSLTALVKLWNQRIDYGNTQNAGQDLRFIDADRNSQLNYEMEAWNESGTSYVWVQLDDIKASAASDSIFMYYGNNTVTDDQDTANTWDASYRGVWHFAETGNNDADGYRDATSYGNHARGTNIDTGDSTRGLAGRGVHLNGVDEYLNAGNDASLALGPGSDFTLFALVRPDTVHDGTCICKAVGSSDKEYILGVKYPEADVQFDMEDNSNNGAIQTDDDVISDDTWHLVAMTFGNAGLVPTIYVDGTAYDTVVISAIDDLPDDDAAAVEFGYTGYNTSNYFDGIIDEIRIMDVVKTPLWMEAQDSSVRDHLFDFGSEVCYRIARVDSTTYWACGSDDVDDDSLIVYFNTNLEFGSLPLGAGNADHAFTLMGLGHIANATIDTPAGCPDTNFVYIRMNAGDTLLSHARSILALTADSAYSTLGFPCAADTDSVRTCNAYNMRTGCGYATIELALLASTDDDTVTVFDAGYYTDTLNFERLGTARTGVSAVVTGAAGMYPVIKNNGIGQTGHPAWQGLDMMVYNEGEDVEIHGFCFDGVNTAGGDTTGTFLWFDRGVVASCSLRYANAKFDDGNTCTFTGNVLYGMGLNWWTDDGGSITGNRVSGCRGDNALYLYGAENTTVENNVFHTNNDVSTVIQLRDARNNVIRNNLMYRNDAVAINSSNAMSERNRYIGNTIVNNSAGLQVDSASAVRNNILFGNANYNIALRTTATTHKDSITYNYYDTTGAAMGDSLTGEGNVITTACPLFSDSSTGDFHLRVHSPCIDRADTAAAYGDYDGGRCDMGAYGGPYALDTLMPPVLDTLTVLCARTNQHDSLTWSSSPAADFRFYAVYRDTVPDFIPSEASCVDSVAAKADTAAAYGNGGKYYYYKVSTADLDDYGSGYCANSGALLELAKKSNRTVTIPGDTITYTIYYDNDGPAGTSDTALMVDYLPRFTTFLDTVGCRLHTGGSLIMMWYNGASWKWTKPASQESVKAVCWRISPDIGAQYDEGDDNAGADLQMAGVDTTPGFDSGWVRFRVRVR